MAGIHTLYTTHAGVEQADTLTKAAAIGANLLRRATLSSWKKGKETTVPGFMVPGGMVELKDLQDHQLEKGAVHLQPRT
eukprot:5482538-Heterocapsa_arctica.AAC.1